MRLLHTAIHAIPPERMLAWAGRCGGLWFRLHRDRREIALENLRLAFPECSETERIQMARRSFGSLARAAAESVIGERLIGSAGAYRRRAVVMGDWPEILKDVRAGRGGVLVSAHHGSWELGARWLGRVGVPYRAIMRTLENPVINELAIKQRGGASSVIAKRGAMRGAVRALKQREWVIILADQNAGKHGIFAPFFGIPACTFTTPATLAFRYRVPVYVVVNERSRVNPTQFEYIAKRLEVDLSEESDASVQRFLAAMNTALETLIRRNPSQYNWCHRRFKTRPPNAVPGPREPAYARFPGVVPARPQFSDAAIS